MLDRLYNYGGERGIRTPVPVFAGNMISNFRKLFTNTIKSDFLTFYFSLKSYGFYQMVVRPVVQLLLIFSGP